MVNLFRPDTWVRRRGRAESGGEAAMDPPSAARATSKGPLPRSQAPAITTGADESLHDAIRELAYFKWKAAGCPDGQDDRFWLDAERELLCRQR